MCIPTRFKQENREDLLTGIREIKFGALVIFSEGRFFSSHIPFLVKEEHGNIFLEGHVVKVNELWKNELTDHNEQE